MKIGLAITRCGESQCSTTLREDLSRFHCVHMVNNVSPVYAAKNMAMKKCFDDGAEWVAMMDGDMELNQDVFWPEMAKALASGRGAVYFLLQDVYINHRIYAFKVMSREWLESGGWYRDEIASDIATQKNNMLKKQPVYDPKVVVGTHFRNPTQFQIFRRWYARGAKDTAGFRDNTHIDYEWSLKGLAHDAYMMGKGFFERGEQGDVHNLPKMLEEYHKYLGNDGLVCGCCVWGDFPYHFQGTFRAGDARLVFQRDSQLKAAYINRLAIGVGQLMKVPHRMVYLAPEPVDGVVPECEWVKMDSPFPTGNLRKLAMYHPDVLKLGSRFIFFDLDNVPLRDLSVMDEALKKSNGFLSRSERLTYKNIPGGDHIGFTRDVGAKVWKWMNDFLPTNPPCEFGDRRGLLDQGQERFVLREMVKNHFPEHAQYWWEFMGDKQILHWKPQVQHHPKLVDKRDAVLLTVWGKWKMHDILGSFPNQAGWVHMWENRWWENRSDTAVPHASLTSCPADKKPITMLVPSLGRAEVCRHLFRSAMKTAKQPDLIQWRIGIVDEDDQKDEYIESFGIGRVFSISGPVRYIAQINRLAMGADDGLVWVGNDDIIFRTQGWDEMVRQAAAPYQKDGVFAIQGEDGFHRSEPSCTLPFISKRLVDIMGGVYPFVFFHIGCDAWLGDIMKRLQRFVFLPDMLNEHVHPTRKQLKVKMDETYQITQNVYQNETDRNILRRSEFMRAHVASVLRGYMTTTV